MKALKICLWFIMILGHLELLEHLLTCHTMYEFSRKSSIKTHNCLKTGRLHVICMDSPQQEQLHAQGPF